MVFHRDVSSLLQLLLVTITVLQVRTADPELKLLNIVFRHGDRAPDRNGLEMYPNDPYLNSSFYPMGSGGLTNEGKRRLYGLGQNLRSRYDKFLDNIYQPSDLEAFSSDYERTKMSLQLVLSGLYPPASIQQWNKNLLWQPVATTYKPNEDDSLLIPEYCPKFIRENNRVRNSPEVLKYTAKFGNLTKFVEGKTGKPINNSSDLYNIYLTLMAESSMGLSLPDWTKDVFPDGELFDATILEYDVLSYNEELKRLNGGMLVRKFVENMQNRMNDSLRRQKNLHLYSGHETNIAAVLQSLGIYKPHVPQYSSAVIVELLHRDYEYFVIVRHYLGIPPEEKVQIIPGCSELCPFEKFLSLVRDVIPSDEEVACDN